MPVARIAHTSPVGQVSPSEFFSLPLGVEKPRLGDLGQTDGAVLANWREPPSPSIGHFPQVHAVELLTRRTREFAVRLFGSPNIARFEVALWREHSVGTHQAQVAVRFAFINAEKARRFGFVLPK